MTYSLLYRLQCWKVIIILLDCFRNILDEYYLMVHTSVCESSLYLRHHCQENTADGLCLLWLHNSVLGHLLQVTSGKDVPLTQVLIVNSTGKLSKSLPLSETYKKICIYICVTFGGGGRGSNAVITGETYEEAWLANTSKCETLNLARGFCTDFHQTLSFGLKRSHALVSGGPKDVRNIAPTVEDKSEVKVSQLHRVVRAGRWRCRRTWSGAWQL